MENKKGCVYFFRHIGLSPIKIGYSENESPIFRFDQFKTYAPFGAELIGFIPSEKAKLLETELHIKYSRDRIKGEWFEITKEEAEKCISFYSNINDIEEMNSFQIAWAKSKCKEKEYNVDDDVVLFLSNYSTEEKIGFEKIITNQSEISSFLNINKNDIRHVFRKLELIQKSYKVNGKVKSGTLLYKKVE